MSSLSGPAKALLATLTEVDGVLFDMDGVLLDTEPLYTVAYDRLLAPFGAHLDRETKLEVMGRKAIESAEHVLTKFEIPLSPEEFLQRRVPVLNELFQETVAIPGVETVVRHLKEAGKPLAIATSSSRSVFELKTKNHVWFDLFDKIVCGDDPDVAAPKPAPDIFLLAAQRLGLSAVACAVFEDSPSGVQAALAAGTRVIAYVPNPVEEGRFPAGCLFIRSMYDVAAAMGR
jgi:pseudouridine-5'-monophosphatase